MMDDQGSRLPAHRTIVIADNLDTVRCTLPEDQRHAIAIGIGIIAAQPQASRCHEPLGDIVLPNDGPDDRSPTLNRHHETSIITECSNTPKAASYLMLLPMLGSTSMMNWTLSRPSSVRPTMPNYNPGLPQ